MSKIDTKKLVKRAEHLLGRLEALIPTPATEPDVDSACVFRWRKFDDRVGVLKPVRYRSTVRLSDLLKIDRQKEALVTNTRQFLAGLPANNVLLWGPRGTGKSSLIKALVNEYTPAGLKLVEVERDHLVDLPEIVDELEGLEGKFIVFCDDLSFEAGDASYKALKVVLDGSISTTPDNIAVYATSNRRHLLPERMSDNDPTEVGNGEIHFGEAVEEKISLSERFGLWLAFHPFTQEDYLHIVRHWLQELGVDTMDDAIESAALQWALGHGSRSGRSAWQFAKDWAGKTGLQQLGTP